MLPGNVRAHPFEASLAKRPAGTRPHGGGPKLRRLGERRKAARGPSPRSSRLGHLTLGTGTAGGCPPVASGCRQRPGRGCREGGAVPPRGTGRPPAPGWPLDVREGAPASACGPAFAGRPSGEAESLPARGRRGAPAGAGERAGGGWVGGWGGERGAAAPRGRWRAGADRQRPASRRRAAGGGQRPGPRAAWGGVRPRGPGASPAVVAPGPDCSPVCKTRSGFAQFNRWSEIWRIVMRGMVRSAGSGSLMGVYLSVLSALEYMHGTKSYLIILELRWWIVRGQV